MKALKIVVLSFLSILIIIYLAFLFILPYAIDFNRYLPQITKSIQQNTGIQLEVKGLKVKTVWNLSVSALVDKVDLKYSNGEKFAQINELGVNVPVLHLILGKIKVNKISADKVFANIDEEKRKKEKEKRNCSIFQSLNLSTKMPCVFVKKYRISLIEGKNNYTIKGSDLKISDFVLNEKINVKTDGNLFLNGRKQISYNINVFSEVFPENKNQKTEIIKIFEDLYKYNINANINTDLKILNNSDIDGKVDLDKISFTFGNKVFPQSTLKLEFSGDKAKINAGLHVDKDSKAVITGGYKPGKNKLIDLHVISDKLDIKDVILITKAMSKPFGIKKIHNIDAGGHIKADFNIKSDFKKIESSGYLEIKDANIINKLYNVKLSSINANIDFSQNAVKIKKANAKLNGQPITINGSVDEKAIANISVLAQNLQLKGVLLALGQTKILKENEILSGEVNLTLLLKGRLDKAFPKVKILLSNVNLKNKPTKTQIKLAKAAINMNYDKQNLGRSEITGLKAYFSTGIIFVPKLNLNFDKKDLNIEKTYLYIDKIKTTLSGKISGLNSNPVINSVMISVPNQISVPISGYSGSNITLKGNLTLNGSLYKPDIQGAFSLPLINIPAMSIGLKDTTLQINKDITLNCPNVQIADSLMNFTAKINKDFSKGITAKNVNFKASNINLNSIIPVIKNLPDNSNSNLTVLNGKSTINKFRVGGINSSNITSDISLKNNILYLDNLFGEAYLGKIGGNIRYDLKNRKTIIDMQGRDLSANPALSALIGRDDDINGKLDFDGNVSMTGHSKKEILGSLKGNTSFIISNGKMGVLGKFEHLLYAQNVLSSNIFKATLNLAAKAIMVKNTGVYKYMKGEMNLSNGWANIDWIKTSGPSMSLYITGRYYLPNNTANLTILGRISDDIVNILGPIGEFSMNKAISSIPQIGQITEFFANKFTTNPNYENISKIPYLTPKTNFGTKEFKVIIDGDVQKQSSVKSFKWLSQPKIQSPQPEKGIAPSAPVMPDFVKNLPDLKK